MSILQKNVPSHLGIEPRTFGLEVQRTILCANGTLMLTNKSFKGIDRPFGGGVESILIRSVFVNWRLGNFCYLILNGLHHKISKKVLYAA
jgi:hypothetical protein